MSEQQYIVTVEYIVDAQNAEDAENRVLHNAGLARTSDIVGTTRKVGEKK